MFSEKSPRILLLIIVKVILTLSLLPRSASAQIEGDLELLKLVANGYKANLAKIKMWQGKAIISHEGPYFNPGETVKRKISVEFVFDANQGAVRWYWNELERQITRKNMQSVNENPYFTSGIVKDKTLYMLFPVPSAHERPPGNVIVKPASLPIRNWDGEFDPMYYFASIEGDLYERLMFYYEQADNPNIGYGKVWRKENRVFFEKASPGTTAIVTVYKFDLSKSCCITRYFRKYADSIGQETWDYDYEDVNDVFVPKNIRFSQAKPDGSEKTTRIIQFVQNIMNKPIESEEFSLAKLSLIPGDIVQEQSTGVTFTYNGTNNEK